MTKFYRNLFLFFISILVIQNVNAQNVVVTPASTPATMCVGNSFIALDTIFITETANGNFSSGNGQTYILSLPANYQFNTGVTPNVLFTGTGLLANGVPVLTTNSLSFTYDAAPSSGSGINSIKICNLQVQAINIGTTGDIQRSGGTASQAGNGSGVQSHCSLTSLSNVAITSQPTDKNICTGGSNVSIFDITATGAGLTYTWQRDNNDGSDGAGFDTIKGSLLSFYSNPTPSNLTDITPATAQNGFLFRCIVSSTCGGPLTSNVATLSVGNPVSTTNPSNQSPCSGGNATFSVTGTNAVSYQWEENGSPITNGGVYSGTTTNSLTLTGVTTGMSGRTYRCVVTGSCGIPATSASRTLTVNTATAIISQPVSQIACVGTSPSFTVVATGSALTYNWVRDRNDASGFSSPSSGYTFSSGSPTITANTVSTSQNGYLFKCTVSGACGPAVVSDIDTLTVYSSSTLNYFGLDANYCKNALVDTLTGFPTGGVFSGTGVTDLGGGKCAFDPSIPAAGATSVIYTLGCAINKSTTIKDFVAIKFTTPANPNPVYSNTPTPIDLVVELSAGPAGALSGTFSGAGVSGTQFHPDLAGLGIHPVTFTYVNSNGCTSKVTKNFTVTNPGLGIPKLLAGSPYCQNSGVTVFLNDTTVQSGYTDDAGVKTLFGSGTAIEGRPWFFDFPFFGTYQFVGYEGLGISYVGNIAGHETWKFMPTVAGSYVIKYKYSYTSIFGGTSINDFASQTIIVNSQTSLSLTGIPPGICNTSSSFDLIPSPGIVTGQTGTGLSIVSPASPPSGTLSGTDNGTFSPTVSGPGTFTVRYHYKASNGCITDLDQDVVVSPQPAKPVVSLNPGYCVSSPIVFPIPVSVSGAVFTDAFSDVNFSGAGSAISGKAFVPTTATPGLHTIRYSYTNQYGCGNFADTAVYVYGLPVPVFSISKFCATSATIFSGKSSTHDAFSTNSSYTWDFGDNNSSSDVSSLDSTSYVYPKTFDPTAKQSYLVRLTVGTNRGCFKTDTTTITVGNIPEADFKWTGICPSDPFTSFTDISGFPSNQVASYLWNFDDLSTSNNTLQNPTHKMNSGTGAYNVKFKISSIRGCVDSIVRKVNILDQYRPSPSDPYIKTFAFSDADWAVDGQNPSWKWGSANKSHITTGTRNVWVTNTTGNYNSDEKSYLNGPCINFQDLERPMISLKIWSATDSNKLAGTVLQYSQDGGTTWNLVGKQGDGVNWYDGSGIVGAPGGIGNPNPNPSAYGWTGVDLAGWRVAKIGLSQLARNSSVRIRLAFAGINFLLRDGFALDSVWLGERDKISLVENFTNSSSPAVVVPDANLNALVDSRPNDLVAIHYHTGFPGSDPINLRDQVHPSSRVLYYGIPSVPNKIFEGNYDYGTVLDTNDIDRRSLDHAKFKIDLKNTISTTNSLNIRAKITAREAVSNDFAVQVVAIERNISAVPGNFQWSMVRMLPDAAGTFFNRDFAVGDSAIVDLNWNFAIPAEVYDTSQLGVIVFIQDIATKEVYQTAYVKGTKSNALPVTGLSDPSEELSLQVYPNPSSETSFIMFNKKVSENYDWEVYDQLGKTMDHGTLRKESEGFVLNTDSYPAGMYVVKIGNGKNLLYTKLLVTH